MRISENQILNEIKSLKNTKLNNVKVGEIVNAKIVEVSDGKVIAEIKGKLVLLNNLLEFNLNEGQTVELEIINKEDGKVFAKPTSVEGEFNKTLDYEMIKTELKSLGLETTDKNIKILDFLKEENISYSKNEINELLKNVKYIEKLIDHIEKGEVDIKKIDIDNDLRKELIKVITNKESKDTQIQLKSNLKENTLDLLKVLLKTNDENIKNIGNEVKSEAKDQTKIVDETVKLNVNSETELKSSLISELKNVDLENIMLLIKEKLGINISKLLLTKNFLEDGKSIAKSLDKIINIFNNSEVKLSSDDIKSIINKMFVSDSKELENIIKELTDKFSMNGSNFKEEINNIKEEVLFINKANEFNSELNDKINYLQFTLMENENLRNAEVFVKKRLSSNKNGKFKIYLSLDTKKYDTVKSIVELEKNNLEITFITVDDNAKEIFQSKEDELKNIISKMKFNNVAIKFRLKNDNNKKIEILLDEVSNRIDMKV